MYDESVLDTEENHLLRSVCVTQRKLNKTIIIEKELGKENRLI